MAIVKYCSRNVVAVTATVFIPCAAKLIMNRYHIGYLALAKQIVPECDLPEDILADHDIQSRDLITAKESEDVTDQMRRFHTCRLPIVDEQGRLVELVAVDDLLGVLANYLSTLSLLMGYRNLRPTSERDHGL